MDVEGLVANNENEKSLICKDVRRFNASQGQNLINSHTPSIASVNCHG